MKRVLLCGFATLLGACSGRVLGPEDLAASTFNGDAAATDASPSGNSTSGSPNTPSEDAGADAPVEGPAKEPDHNFLTIDIGSLMTATVGAKLTITTVLTPADHSRIVGSGCTNLAIDGNLWAGGVLYEVTNWTSRTLVVDVEQTGGGTASPQVLIGLAKFPFYASDIVNDGSCTRFAVGTSTSRPALKSGNGLTVGPNKSFYVYAQDSTASGSYSLAMQFAISKVL